MRISDWEFRRVLFRSAGDTTGGATTGGMTTGGDTTGGDTTGGTTAGGSTAGGDTAGGSTPDGTTDGAGGAANAAGQNGGELPLTTLFGLLFGVPGRRLRLRRGVRE